MCNINRMNIVGRQRLPDRRASESFSLECNGLAYTATVSRFADGRPGEIFLSCNKGGSAADSNARDAAVVASIALQYGASLDAIRHALMRDGSGRAFGPLAAALDIVGGI
jgi:hypothetical protein